MITGDNALTACHIAKQVEILKGEALILDTWDGNLEWRTIDENIKISIDLDSMTLKPELRSYELAITGNALSSLISKPMFKKLLPLLWVYARVSPSQKEAILMSLKDAGYCTLMCGDGTNDVGALKQAHVGIALLDGTVEDMKKIQARQIALRKKMFLERQEELNRRKLELKHRFATGELLMQRKDSKPSFSASFLLIRLPWSK